MRNLKVNFSGECTAQSWSIVRTGRMKVAHGENIKAIHCNAKIPENNAQMVTGAFVCLNSKFAKAKGIVFIFKFVFLRYGLVSRQRLKKMRQIQLDKNATSGGLSTLNRLRRNKLSSRKLYPSVSSLPLINAKAAKEYIKMFLFIFATKKIEDVYIVYRLFFFLIFIYLA